MSDIVHLVLREGSGLLTCCGRTPFEVPHGDRLSIDAAEVTCKGRHLSALPDLATAPAVPHPTTAPEWRPRVTLPFDTPAPRAQQYEPEVVYTFRCVGCRTPLEEDGTTLWWSGDVAVEETESLIDAGWGEIDGRYYCPGCSHTCWEADGETRPGMQQDCPDCAPQGAR